MHVFSFLRQAHSVELLLNLCVQALPSLPSALSKSITDALRNFETSSAVTMWATGDINDDPEQAPVNVLSKSERVDVINRLCTGYECNDSDWSELDRLCDQVRADRPTASEPETALFDAETQTGFLLSLEDSGNYFAEQWQAGVIVQGKEGTYAIARDWIDNQLPAHLNWLRSNTPARSTH